MCPMYEYECRSCKHRFTEILPLSKIDDPLSEDCVYCGNCHIERVPTCGSFKINGYSEANGYSKRGK